MDNVLETIRGKLNSNELLKLIEAVHATNQLPECIALGVFELIRRAAHDLTDHDRQQLEAAIAATQRPGLNRKQVAKEISIYLNNTDKLTEKRFQVLREILLEVHEGEVPPLRQRKQLQLASLVLAASKLPCMKRPLAKALYDWRGQLRPDAQAIADQFPSLKTTFAELKLHSWLQYPGCVLSNMSMALKQGHAVVGFAVLLLLFGGALTYLITRSMAAPAPAAANTAPALSEKTLPLSKQLQAALKDQGLVKRMEKSFVIVLDHEANAVVEALKAAEIHPVYTVNQALGVCPHGSAWLTSDDLKLIKREPSEGMALVAGFVPGKQSGQQQFQIVNLVNREVLVAVTCEGTVPSLLSSAEYLQRADHHLRTGSLDLARLEFRKALATAKNDAELGQYYRRLAWARRAENASREEVLEKFRLALQHLPPREAASLREKLPAEVELSPTSVEIENSSGKSTSLPDGAKK